MKTFFMELVKKLSSIAFTSIFVCILQPYFDISVQPDDNSKPNINIPVTSSEYITSSYGYVISDFPHIEQGKKYPTGCEIISTLMVLHYYGYDADADTLISEYLPCAEIYSEDNKYGESIVYSSDPNEFFIGDPYDDTSLGCYSPVIANVIKDYCGDDVKVINKKGTKLSKLVKEYVSNDIPVILWATMNMDESWNSVKWNIVGTDREFAWISGEHCLVLIGYDSDNYYFSDPAKKSGITAYPKKTVEKRYAELGEQSVVMIPEK